MKMLSNIVKLFAVLALSALLGHGQASPTLANTVTKPNNPKLKGLLSQPSGLANAASQTGHLIVESYNPPANNLTIAQLASNSDVIVLCKVVGRVSSIDSSTNIVTTRVHVQVDEQLKGTAPRDSYVNIPGGLVVFGSNSVADVRTVETKGISDGREVLLFLTTADAATFTPTNGMEGMFWISLADGFVTSMTKYDRHVHLVQSISQTLASLRPQLKAAAATTEK